jgi:hypothetical protein
MTEILLSFASMPKAAFSSAARSFIRLRSLLQSLFPFRDINARRILSLGDWLEGIMEGEMEMSRTRTKIYGS